MENIKYYEVEFEDGYSICIKGKRKPTVNEATEFCKPECEESGKVVDVLDIDKCEAYLFFDMENEEGFPVFE